MRSFAIVAVTVVGALMVAVAAAAFNLAGLYWQGTSFGQALFWDPQESGITVAFGCAMLVGWVISAATALIISRVDVEPDRARRVRVVGTWCTILSVAVGVALLVTSLVVLPAQYDWVRY